jgi:PHD/YefM family antitoxin component YafN of YafNO toxin-antitoxin module
MIDITAVSKFEVDYDQVIEDVAVNKQHYFIKTEDEAVAVIPAEEYLTLVDIYESWISERPLPHD